MRSIYRKTVVLALTLMGLGAFVQSSQAQIATVRVPFTQQWRYYVTNQSGPTGNWHSNIYPAESSWPLGNCTFGTEDPNILDWPQGTVIDPPSASGGPDTVYFRTHFTFSGSTAGVTFVFTNLLDDGAVFYINGRQVQRVRMAAAPTAINYASWATGGPPTEGSFERFTVVGAASYVTSGDNVLAVEVHNVNTTSSDTVFACSLASIAPTPLVITNDLPATISAEEGKAVTLVAGVEGPDPVFRWFRNGLSAGVTTPTFTINPSTNMNGQRYNYVATNILNKVTSQVAVLTVRQDVYPPGLVSAVAESSNTVQIVFTEPVNPTNAPNVTNYVIRRVGSTNRVAISNAVHNGDTVTLTVGGANWIYGSNYVLIVTNVSDLNRPRYNMISASSNMAYIAFPKTVLPWNWPMWAYENVNAYYYLGENLPTNWNSVSYNETNATDGLWELVASVGYYSPSTPPSLCAGASYQSALDMVAATSYDRTNFTTYYFRSHFNLATNAGVGEIRLNYVTDSGIIFYLNGKEIHRFNITSGKVDRYSNADDQLAPACQQIPVTIQVDNLLTGKNVLAAEVHQSAEDESLSNLNLYYGVNMELLYIPDPILPPQLSVDYQKSPANVVVSWNTNAFPGYRLEQATTLQTNRTWSVVSSNSPYRTAPAARTNRFYRLYGPPIVP